MGFEVFGVGVPELVLILVVALIFLGPDKLPDAARTVGGWVRTIRGLSEEAMGIWQETIQPVDDIKGAVRSTVFPPAAAKNGAGTAAEAPALAAPHDNLNGDGHNGADLNGADALSSLSVVYTPPSASITPAPGPATLDYPAPFAAPAPVPTPPETLSYPAPFQGEE